MRLDTDLAAIAACEAVRPQARIRANLREVRHDYAA